MTTNPHMRTDPPWPVIPQAKAARLLGVSPEYLDGMANNPIPAVLSTGRSGRHVWLFRRESIIDLARKLGRLKE